MPRWPGGWGAAAVALLRGHGNVVVAPSLQLAVFRAIYTEINARLEAEALLLGDGRVDVPQRCKEARPLPPPISVRSAAPGSCGSAKRWGKTAMKLYTSIGPNPKAVRMFMAEKGIELPKVEVDLWAARTGESPI